MKYFKRIRSEKPTRKHKFKYVSEPGLTYMFYMTLMMSQLMKTKTTKLRKKRSTQLLRECWSFLAKLMTCQNLQNKLLNITILFIWYLLASLKKCHSPNIASSISFWWVLVSVHSPNGECLKKMVSHTGYVLLICRLITSVNGTSSFWCVALE